MLFFGVTTDSQNLDFACTAASNEADTERRVSFFHASPTSAV